jgi:luciferase family oxidoreductase group 1
MLPHYSPMKVAEVFRVLHALYPGRVDLGIGRAPGGTPLESYALWRTRGEHPQSDDFGQQLVELLAFLNRRFPSNHPFSRIRLSPEMPGGPEVWLLGSSMWSASAAAQVGLPYAFAHFIDPLSTRTAIEHYRSHFESENNGPSQPYTILAVGALCADTEEQAERLISSARVFRRRIRRGELGPIPTPKEAMREMELDAPAEPSRASESEFPRYVVGTADRVRDRLIDMASALGVDELMIVTVMHGHSERKRSYQLLAEAFALKSRS